MMLDKPLQMSVSRPPKDEEIIDLLTQVLDRLNEMTLVGSVHGNATMNVDTLHVERLCVEGRDET